MTLSTSALAVKSDRCRVDRAVVTWHDRLEEPMIARLRARLHARRRRHQVYVVSRALGLPPRVWCDEYCCRDCGRKWLA